MWAEFRQFIARGNVVDLAIGVILGTAFTAIVTSLVNDLLMPPLGWVAGGLDFSNFFIVVGNGDYATLAEAKEAGAVTINYGMFVNTIIRFLIIAFAVFILVRQVNRLYRKEAAAPSAPPAPARSEVLLEEIRDLLRQRAGGA